jgi:hypothetical protein
VEIKMGIVDRYLDHATAYIGDEGGEPDDVTGYHDYIIDMKKSAVRQGDADVLLLGIDYLLLNPSLYSPYFETVYYIYDADEMEELLQYIRAVAYPDAPPLNPETIKDVKLVMSGPIFDAEVKLL